MGTKGAGTLPPAIERRSFIHGSVQVEPEGLGIEIRSLSLMPKLVSILKPAIDSRERAFFRVVVHLPSQ